MVTWEDIQINNTRSVPPIGGGWYTYGKRFESLRGGVCLQSTLSDGSEKFTPIFRLFFLAFLYLVLFIIKLPDYGKPIPSLPAYDA